MASAVAFELLVRRGGGGRECTGARDKARGQGICCDTSALELPVELVSEEEVGELRVAVQHDAFGWERGGLGPAM